MFTRERRGSFGHRHIEEDHVKTEAVWVMLQEAKECWVIRCWKRRGRNSSRAFKSKMAWMWRHGNLDFRFLLSIKVREQIPPVLSLQICDNCYSSLQTNTEVCTGIFLKTMAGRGFFPVLTRTQTNCKKLSVVFLCAQEEDRETRFGEHIASSLLHFYWGAYREQGAETWNRVPLLGIVSGAVGLFTELLQVKAGQQ